MGCIQLPLAVLGNGKINKSYLWGLVIVPNVGRINTAVPLPMVTAVVFPCPAPNNAGTHSIQKMA